MKRLLKAGCERGVNGQPLTEARKELLAQRIAAVEAVQKANQREDSDHEENPVAEMTEMAESTSMPATSQERDESTPSCRDESVPAPRDDAAVVPAAVAKLVPILVREEAVVAPSEEPAPALLQQKDKKIQLGRLGSESLGSGAASSNFRKQFVH